MASQPYTPADLVAAAQIVRQLHGLKGFDAWAERIAKALAAEREAAERGRPRTTHATEAEIQEFIGALQHLLEFLGAGLCSRSSDGYIHFLPLCNDEIDIV